MRVSNNLGFFIFLILFLLVGTLSAQHPAEYRRTRLLPTNPVRSFNNLQRVRGHWYSSGYHYRSPGYLPHENWSPYQDLQSIHGVAPQPVYQPYAPSSEMATVAPEVNRDLGQRTQQSEDDKMRPESIDRSDATPPAPVDPERKKRNADPSPSDRVLEGDKDEDKKETDKKETDKKDTDKSRKEISAEGDALRVFFGPILSQ